MTTGRVTAFTTITPVKRNGTHSRTSGRVVGPPIPAQLTVHESGMITVETRFPLATLLLAATRAVGLSVGAVDLCSILVTSSLSPTDVVILNEDEQDTQEAIPS